MCSQGALQYKALALQAGPVARRGMDTSKHVFVEGDRVRAQRRRDFPLGTVVKLMALGFVLVRWDGDVLETAHHSDLAKADDRPS